MSGWSWCVGLAAMTALVFAFLDRPDSSELQLRAFRCWIVLRPRRLLLRQLLRLLLLLGHRVLNLLRDLRQRRGVVLRGGQESQVVRWIVKSALAGDQAATIFVEDDEIDPIQAPIPLVLSSGGQGGGPCL